MTATITQVIKQFQQEWTSQFEPDAILAACRGVTYRWRERTLNPVTTIQLFFVQILHGNTACTHLRHLTKLNVTASAYCQARMKLPLAVFEQLLRSVSTAFASSTSRTNPSPASLLTFTRAASACTVSIWIAATPTSPPKWKALSATSW